MTCVVNMRDRSAMGVARREGFVRIDRATKWGNPFRLQPGESREACLAKYEEWLRQQPELMASLHELRGKALGCWCAPRLCHGDVLARLADELEPEWIPCPDCGISNHPGHWACFGCDAGLDAEES